MVSIPTIKPETIINYCGKKMYYSGKHFLHTKSFYIFYREWMVLKGVCEGTSNPSYFVKIVFDDHGITHSSCTCYSNRFAPCKHIAALLMIWEQKPADFPERIQWLRQLKEVTKKDLIELIEKMVDFYPEIGDTCSTFIGES